MVFADQYLIELQKAVAQINTDVIQKVIDLLDEARLNGRQIFTCGNGGSASTASHFACDIVKGASYNSEKRFRIMALTDQLATLTAYANDVSYESVFVEQLKNFARSGDVVIALSGSGNSANVLHAVEYANSVGCETVGLTGRDGGKLAKMVHLNIHVPVGHMGQIEDSHLIVCHIIGYYFMEETQRTKLVGKTVLKAFAGNSR